MNISEIKEQISQQGLKRIKYDLNDINSAMQNFKEILSEMLIHKEETLQWELIEYACRYFINWTYQLPSSDMEFNKGILLKGKTGRGKTFLFRAWKYFLSIDNVRAIHNDKQFMIDPLIVNVKKISGEYQDPETGGYQVIDKYGRVKSLMLDDIGKEDEFSRSYGNKINIIEEIINLREDQGLLTFGTTNKESLKELYDDRTVSRMYKLFNILPINHDIDFRIQ